jgi:hypothetical protein
MRHTFWGRQDNSRNILLWHFSTFLSDVSLNLLPDIIKWRILQCADFEHANIPL